MECMLRIRLGPFSISNMAEMPVVPMRANMTGVGWFEWALRVNTTKAGDNVWGFAQCYELGYLKYANIFGVPS